VPTEWAIAGGALIVAIVAAYTAGRYAGRASTVAWRPIFQLLDHRVQCRGEPPARARAELAAMLGLPPDALREMAAPTGPLDRRAHARRQQADMVERHP
jgi:hypothetical protein